MSVHDDTNNVARVRAHDALTALEVAALAWEREECAKALDALAEAEMALPFPSNERRAMVDAYREGAAALRARRP